MTRIFIIIHAENAIDVNVVGTTILKIVARMVTRLDADLVERELVVEPLKVACDVALDLSLRPT